VQSTGSSGVVALGNGVIADFAPSAEGGILLGFARFGVAVASALGPILGGEYFLESVV